MKFTSDPRKNRANVTRHGVAFEDAVKIFEGPTLERPDYRFDYGEPRVYAIGVVNGTEVTLIYSEASGRLSRRGRQRNVKEKRIGKTPVKPKTDWRRLRSLTDSEVEAGIRTGPDVKPTTRDFWAGASVVLPRPKQTITIRLDSDLLEWLRREKGYQSRINAILRAYMAAQDASRST